MPSKVPKNSKLSCMHAKALLEKPNTLFTLHIQAVLAVYKMLMQFQLQV